LVKKHDHTSFQLMIVLISKALIQKEKKSITLEVAPTLPLLFVLFSIFLLSYFLPRLPFWVFSLADFSSFFLFFSCVQTLTSILIHFKAHTPLWWSSMEYKEKIYWRKVMGNGMGKEVNFSNSMYTNYSKVSKACHFS